jgi:hypothetical protein
MLLRLARILDVLAVHLSDPKEIGQGGFTRYYRDRFFRFLWEGSLYQPSLLSETEQKEHSEYWTRFQTVIKAGSDPTNARLITLVGETLPPQTHADVALRAMHTGFIYRNNMPLLVTNAVALAKITHFDPKSCMDAISAALLTSFVYNGKDPSVYVPDLIDFFRKKETSKVPFSQEEVDSYLMPWISYQEWELKDDSHGATPPLTRTDPESRWARLKEYLDLDSQKIGDGSTDVLIAALDTILTPLQFEPFFFYNVLSWGNNETITLVASIWYEKLYPDACLDLPKVWADYGI